MVDSRTVWQAKKGDDQNSIFAQAVKEGSTAAAMANIQGFHPKRLMLVIDEGTDTPAAIYEVVDNLISGPEEFKMLVIGNPDSKFDLHGKFCEPKNGWKSVTVNDDEWETKPKFNKPGILVRFDAAKSPNFLYDSVKYPFLVTRQRYKDATEGIGENKPSFWKFWRGFWAPSGMVQTVMDEALLTKMEVKLEFEWKEILGPVAGCDPAFGGGDRPIFRIGLLGILESGKPALYGQSWEEIPLDASQSDVPIHYQIARFCKKRCEQLGIPPNRFGMDATGEGGGTCDILSYEWSPEIHRCEFGGAVSDMAVSSENMKPANEVYDRKVSELWFRCANLVRSGQLSGIEDDTASEFCTRTWDFKGRKQAVQTKREMKESFGKSPDLADSFAVMVDTAMYSGLYESNEGSVTDKYEQENPEEDAYDIYEDEVGDEMEEVEHVYSEAS
jgi:hypothetical protein